ncbi:hypothetical protein INR49_007135, partial [Caranx melampygus]
MLQNRQDLQNLRNLRHLQNLRNLQNPQGLQNPRHLQTPRHLQILKNLQHLQDLQNLGENQEDGKNLIRINSPEPPAAAVVVWCTPGMPVRGVEAEGPGEEEEEEEEDRFQIHMAPVKQQEDVVNGNANLPHGSDESAAATETNLRLIQFHGEKEKFVSPLQSTFAL